MGEIGYMQQAGLVIVLFCYLIYIFRFIDSILVKVRGKKWHRIFICLFEAILCLGLILLPISTSTWGYFVFWGMLIANFTICYKTAFIKGFFCAAACSMHFMAIRSITTAVFSIVFNKTIYEIANRMEFLVVSMTITFLLLCLAIWLVIKYIPTKTIRIITQYKEQLWFMSVWMVLFNLYFILNACVYATPQTHKNLVENQLLMPIIILIGLYVVLFYTMKTVNLLGYKEKNEILQSEMEYQKLYRNRMTKDIVADYEFNFTKNLVVRGYEEYEQEYGETIKNYDDMQNILIAKMVHSEDETELRKFDTCEKVIEAFRLGVKEHVEDYRRLNTYGNYQWVRSATTIWEDESNREIKGYSYIKDIHEDKKRQLELQRKAERDSLTGLYNKGVTEKRIAEYIEQREEHKKGALFIIDVDNFKVINDHLGHTFGDVVLCELADKLKAVFRKNDIVGRIGGDEFMVFVQDIINKEDITEKAKQIIKAFSNTYVGEDKSQYMISASVGIAIYPSNGETFSELYQNADAALYFAKNDGKSTYHYFQKEQFMPYEGSRTEINISDNKQQKNFQENRIEYVFKILYDAESYSEAIDNVLALLARQFLFDRAYIFEEDEDKQTVSNVYEWCAEGISQEKENLQKIKKDDIIDAMKAFQQEGRFILRSLEDLDSIKERQYLEPQGIKSMVQIAMYDQEKWIGFIGFDDCKRERYYSEAELEEISVLSNIITTFIIKQQSIRKLEKTQSFLTAILDSLDHYTYVIRKGTREILFMNKKTIEVVGDNKDKLPCHLVLRGVESTCGDCPIKKLSDGLNERAVTEIYNEKYKIWVETTASNIKWMDGEPAYLINCTDITRYKEMKEQAE